ncbi:MAG: hypothetical protein LJE83_15360 [Gammaproteobacteria bacterium]|nr:hypothetical protein [Gammaproteobacteria bacterium]
MKASDYQTIWDEIEEGPVQAANLKLRSQLMIEVSQVFISVGVAGIASFGQESSVPRTCGDEPVVVEHLLDAM